MSTLGGDEGAMAVVVNVSWTVAKMLPDKDSGPHYRILVPKMAIRKRDWTRRLPSS